MPASRHVLNSEDVTAVVGPVEDATMAQILALRPTHEELVEAWALATTTDPEPLVAAGKRLDGRVAQLTDLLMAEQEPEEE